MKFLIPFLLLISVFQVSGQIVFRDKAILDSLRMSAKPSKEKEIWATDLFFKFKGVPSKYYHTRRGDALYIEFYDAGLPMRPVSPLVQIPFSHIKISEAKVNVQKIEGLPSDMRDIVRVQMFIAKGYDIDYTASGEYDLKTFVIRAKKGGKLKVTKTKIKSNVWRFGVTLGILAVGAGVVAYIVNSQDKDENPGIYKTSK